MKPGLFFDDPLKQKHPLVSRHLDLAGMRAFLWLTDFANAGAHPAVSIDTVATFVEGLLQEKKDGAEKSERIYDAHPPHFADVIAFYSQTQARFFRRQILDSRGGSFEFPAFREANGKGYGTRLTWKWNRKKASR